MKVTSGVTFLLAIALFGVSFETADAATCEYVSPPDDTVFPYLTSRAIQDRCVAIICNDKVQCDNCHNGNNPDVHCNILDSDTKDSDILNSDTKTNKVISHLGLITNLCGQRLHFKEALYEFLWDIRDVNQFPFFYEPSMYEATSDEGHETNFRSSYSPPGSKHFFQTVTETNSNKLVRLECSSTLKCSEDDFCKNYCSNLLDLGTTPAAIDELRTTISIDSDSTEHHSVVTGCVCTVPTSANVSIGYV